MLWDDFSKSTTAQLFDYFTKTELLAEWWAPESEIEAEVGGSYRLIWPKQGFEMRGKVLAWVPGEHFAFSWAWNTGPANAPPLRVDIYFALQSGGTRIAIFQGKYDGINATDADRNDNYEGWIHFCARLKEVVQSRERA